MFTSEYFTAFQNLINTPKRARKGKVHLVLDRGFQDFVLRFIRDPVTNQIKPQWSHIKCWMPSLLKVTDTTKQFDTKRANYSRIVTKIRWIVEYVNGRIKTQFRMLANVIHNTIVPNTRFDMQIAGAILNLRTQPVYSDNDDVRIATRMLAINGLHPHNRLEDEIKGFDEIRVFRGKERVFTKMDQIKLSDFPKLSKTEMYKITLGSYQLKQSLSYIAQYFQSLKQGNPDA
jgi:hypothetical protein